MIHCSWNAFLSHEITGDLLHSFVYMPHLKITALSFLNLVLTFWGIRNLRHIQVDSSLTPASLANSWFKSTQEGVGSLKIKHPKKKTFNETLKPCWTLQNCEINLSISFHTLISLLRNHCHSHRMTWTSSPVHRPSPHRGFCLHKPMNSTRASELQKHQKYKSGDFRTITTSETVSLLAYLETCLPLFSWEWTLSLVALHGPFLSFHLLRMMLFV